MTTRSYIEIEHLIERIEKARHLASEARHHASEAKSYAATASSLADQAYAELDLLSQAFVNIAEDKVGLSLRKKGGGS